MRMLAVNLTVGNSKTMVPIVKFAECNKNCVTGQRWNYENDRAETTNWDLYFVNYLLIYHLCWHHCINREWYSNEGRAIEAKKISFTRFSKWTSLNETRPLARPTTIRLKGWDEVMSFLRTYYVKWFFIFTASVFFYTFVVCA